MKLAAELATDKREVRPTVVAELLSLRLSLQSGGFSPPQCDSIASTKSRSKAALQCALPLSLPPRGLKREQAAAYVGVSPTKFDEMVADGRMPQPKMIDGRRVWDRHALDAAFAALPDANGNADHGNDVWSRASL